MSAPRLGLITIVPVMVALLVEELWYHHSALLSVLPSPCLFPPGSSDTRQIWTRRAQRLMSSSDTTTLNTRKLFSTSFITRSGNMQVLTDKTQE